MKQALAFLFIAASLSSTAFADETIVKHCEGWIPQYFVDLVKIQEGNQVKYQVNLQGNVTEFTSPTEAQKKFNEDCALVKSWE